MTRFYGIILGAAIATLAVVCIGLAVDKTISASPTRSDYLQSIGLLFVSLVCLAALA